jgi:hypothetical protein
MLLLGSTYGYDPSYQFETPFDVDMWNPGEHIPNRLELNDDLELTANCKNKFELPSNRNAWGLLIQPIENGARYVRVGRFRSAAEEGGLLSFAQEPFQDVEIV